jgi:hypothetical protein
MAVGKLARIIGAVGVVLSPVLLHGCDDILRYLRRVHVEPPRGALADIIHETPFKIPTAAEGIGARSISEESSKAKELLKTKPAAFPVHLVAASFQPPPPKQWNKLFDEEIEAVTFSGGRASKEITNPQLLAAFPTDESEFLKVYDKGSPSASSSIEMNRLVAQLTNEKNTVWTKYQKSENFRAALQRLENADLVAIIAHAEDEGRTIVLPNGTKILYSDLHGTCSELKIICVVLSCYSPDLKITSEITTSDAVTMWNSASKRWKKNPNWNSDDFILDLRTNRSKAPSRNTIYITTVVSTSAIGFGYQLTSSKQKRRNRLQTRN